MTAALPARSRHRRDTKPAGELLSFAETLLTCARCGDCCFRALDKTCRVDGPRVRIVAGKEVTFWPAVKDEDWCGKWESGG